ncbi:MAG: STAS/SEC14 domain-containing protein [Rhizomicrobium sp.]
MIDIIEDFPDNIVAVSCRGHVTRRDYERVLIPTVEARLKKHDKIRLFYRVGPEFDRIDPGAVLEDIGVGFSHLTRWERIALVTDIEWMRLAIRAFAFLLPCPVGFFSASQEPEAREWIVGREPKKGA